MEGPAGVRYGELLDQLREVADLLAEGFNKSGSTSRDLLNGLAEGALTRLLLSSIRVFTLPDQPARSPD